MSTHLKLPQLLGLYPLDGSLFRLTNIEPTPVSIAEEYKLYSTSHKRQRSFSKRDRKSVV